ncbi:APC family permease [Tetragenococcus koreensis]|uniref:Amino acid permease n=1 Tax=Tetragenococcus koreensis TaxID=290335 RepID=A0AAN4RKA8_9ENTE|nr:APC family permease [Tetragenococcus koreensis]MCF1615456.1 APC family permease [Tetragenococcus koreensis]MCF1625250.1 APC family permease [Tetragenococcus koreensis]MCF1627950.1 APC family permease [Tetragenococcus koreensis]GEQ49176.1 amino acid permease [Tetragenococcus koreensis]GEQ51732.1 amino acid permease [Tetragenococcus koreensis]
MEGKKKFSLFSAVLSVICVVFVAEAAAPVAAIGNSQYFWWLFLLITFLLPYGLISSELGTTYIGEGGIYDWVTKAFGHRWGSRVSWYYWINFPLWLASLAVITPDLLATIFGVDFSTVAQVIIQLIFIWVIIWISFYPVSDSVWILNGAAMIKMLLAVLIGGIGVYVAMTRGMANEITVPSLLPSFDLNSLSFISVIIFNLLGFEVICTFAGDMENPNKDIPKSIIVAGIVIAAIYLFSAFGIGVAIPTDQINTGSGLMDSFKLLTGNSSGLFIGLMAFLFLLTLFGNMASWSLGVNNTVCYAAENGDMPDVFAKRSGKNRMPTGAAMMNGVVASIVVVLAPILPNQDLFWSFFSLNLVMFLLSYVPVFPAFYKLRQIDPDTPRPFKVKGNKATLLVLTILPMLMIVTSLIFTAVPLQFDSASLSEQLPITIGAIAFILVGEFIIFYLKIKKKGSKLNVKKN